MFCSKCGAEVRDEAVICPNCGCEIEKAATHSKNGVSGLKIAAKVFMIIATVCSAWCLIPLAWTLPMTISYSRKIKAGEPVGVGFKICSLLFVSLIAGILMLCDND